MNNICTIICQKLRLMLHNSYPITYSYPYRIVAQWMNFLEKKKNFQGA